MNVNKKNLYLTILIVAIFGIILAGVLTAAKYSNSVAVLCGENSSNSCNLVQNSDYSYIINTENFKVPLAFGGVIFYSIITFLAFSLYQYETKKKTLEEKCLKRQRSALFIFGIIGVLFSSWFFYLQAKIIQAFCKYCLVSAFDTVVLLILISIVTFSKDKTTEEKKEKVAKKILKKKKTTKKSKK